MAKKRITGKRELFCKYYVQSREPTQAAVDAGYGNTRKSATEIASRLLKDSEILGYINELDRQMSAAVGLTPELIAVRSEKLYHNADKNRRDNQALKVLKFQKEIAKDIKREDGRMQIELSIVDRIESEGESG